jgi:gamma-glutamyl phosphate reductase
MKVVSITPATSSKTREWCVRFGTQQLADEFVDTLVKAIAYSRLSERRRADSSVSKQTKKKKEFEFDLLMNVFICLN